MKRKSSFSVLLPIRRKRRVHSSISRVVLTKNNRAIVEDVRLFDPLIKYGYLTAGITKLVFCVVRFRSNILKKNVM